MVFNLNKVLMRAPLRPAPYFSRRWLRQQGRDIYEQGGSGTFPLGIVQLFIPLPIPFSCVAGKNLSSWLEREMTKRRMTVGTGSRIRYPLLLLGYMSLSFS